MRFWWVNQNQTYKHEFSGGYMWSPKTNKGGGYSQYYYNMTQVKPADIVFSFKGGEIVSIGIILSQAYTSTKPGEFGKAGESWSKDGWCVDVEYHEVTNKIKPKSHINEIRPLLEEKYAPLQPNGNGNQVYLCELSNDLAAYLVTLIGEEANNIVNGLEEQYDIDNRENETETRILSDDELSQTEKRQLVNSRRGQGVFRSRLENIESCCRITGVSNKRHLIASHIKPWSISSNKERLDGNNGLLLAPHIDHLFDKGYISFNDNGDVIISEKISKSVLASWSVSTENVGYFSPEQKVYLDYHRNNVLKR